MTDDNARAIEGMSRITPSACPLVGIEVLVGSSSNKTSGLRNSPRATAISRFWHRRHL